MEHINRPRHILGLAALIVLVLAAPQAFGGNPPLARRLILAGAAAVALIWPDRLRIAAAGPFGVAGLVALALATAQLVPLPTRWVEAVSPQAVEVRRIAGGDAGEHRPLSLATGRTALGAEHLALGLLVCCVAAAVGQDERRTRWLLAGLVGLGLFEAVYGLGVGYTIGPNVWGFPTGYQVRRGRLTGTYINPDHFAGLLVLLFPLALALAWSSARQRVYASSAITWLARSVDQPGVWSTLMCHAAAVVIGLAILLSASRSAVATMVVAVVLIAVLELASGRARGSRLIAMGVVIAIAIGWLCALGSGLLVDRFEDIEEDAVPRYEFICESARMVEDFPAIGAGFGSFVAVHPAYQEQPLIGIRVNAAHCDWIELATEAGLPFALLALMCTLLVLVRLARQAVDRARPREMRHLDAGLAVALVVALIRAGVEFELRAPGNWVALAAIAGMAAARTGPVRERGTSLWPPLLALMLAVQLLRPIEDAETRIEQAETRLDETRAVARVHASLLVDSLGATDVSTGLEATLVRLSLRHMRLEVDAAALELVAAYREGVLQQPGEPRTHAKLGYWLAIIGVNRGDDKARTEAAQHARAARALFPRGVKWHLHTWLSELAVAPHDPVPARELARYVAQDPSQLQRLFLLAVPLDIAAPLARHLPRGDAIGWRALAASARERGNLPDAMLALDRLVDASLQSRARPGPLRLRFEARARPGTPPVIACARLSDDHLAHMVLDGRWTAYEYAIDKDGDLVLHESTALYRLGTPPLVTFEVREKTVGR